MKKSLRDTASLLTTRREILIAGAAAGAALLVPRTARAAYTYPCNWKAGFMPLATPSGRVGYLTDFAGLGLASPLAKDITVRCAWNSPVAPVYTPVAPSGGNLNVVAILENVSWSGVATDPMSFHAYLSMENAVLLRQSLQLPRNAISTLGFWIAQFDEASKTWFEAAYPSAPVRFGGQVPTAPNSATVDDEPTPSASGVDFKVYGFRFSVGPTGNRATSLHLATSPTASTTANFGVTIVPVPPTVVLPGR